MNISWTRPLIRSSRSSEVSPGSICPDAVPRQTSFLYAASITSIKSAPAMYDGVSLAVACGFLPIVRVSAE